MKNINYETFIYFDKSRQLHNPMPHACCCQQYHLSLYYYEIKMVQRTQYIYSSTWPQAEHVEHPGVYVYRQIEDKEIINTGKLIITN